MLRLVRSLIDDTLALRVHPNVMLEGFLIVCTVFQAPVYIRSFLDKDFAAKCLNLDTFDCEILERLWQVSECVRDGSILMCNLI